MNDRPSDLSSSTLEALLTHIDWVRRLAASLVRDANQADDIAQETWLSALEHPPRSAENLRAWIGKLARNAARQMRRGETRRQRRECEAASPASAASSDAALERAELQRKIVNAVLNLREPYRTVLILAYFEGLPPRDIARLLNVTGSTVRSHLKRGHDLLR